MERIKEITSGYYEGICDLEKALNESGFFVKEATLEKIECVSYTNNIRKTYYTIPLRWLNGETMMIHPDDITSKEVDR